MEGCRHLRRDRQGRQCGGVALYEKGRFDCIALTVSDDMGERPWFQRSVVVSATKNHSVEITGLVSFLLETATSHSSAENTVLL